MERHTVLKRAGAHSGAIRFEVRLPGTGSGFRCLPRLGKTVRRIAALQVKTDAGDCCIGTRATARSLGLGFLHLVSERYDFVIRKKHLELLSVQTFLDTLSRASFRRELEGPGGYDAPAKLDRYLRDPLTGVVHPFELRLFDLLYDLTASLNDAGGEIDVICGYRTPETNEFLRTRSANSESRSTACICKLSISACRGRRPPPCGTRRCVCNAAEWATIATRTSCTWTWAASATGSRVYSAFVQDPSGSNRVTDGAALPPAGSISFSKTVPVWFTINVWMPVTPYSAGQATRPKPPINLPPAR